MQNVVWHCHAETFHSSRSCAEWCDAAGSKEGNVLFNDALNTLYLRLYGVKHREKYHSDSERGNPLPSFRLTARVLLYAPSHRQDLAHTTVFITPVVVLWLEREIAQWVHTIKDRSDDPSHHKRTLLPRRYISLLCMISSRYPITGENENHIFRKNHCLPRPITNCLVRKSA